jgi:hypothetical protein
VPAVVAAVLFTVGIGFALRPHHHASTPAAGPPLGTATLSASDRGSRDTDGSDDVSRSSRRPPAGIGPGESGVDSVDVPPVTGHRWATVELNVWSGPGESTTLIAEIPAGTRVSVTGVDKAGWAEVIRNGIPRWVNAAYLTENDPAASNLPGPSSSASSVSSAPCPSGNAVESGLTPDAVLVHRAVCAAFPQITSYGGLRPGDSGPHGTGQAIDIMVSDQQLGDQIAAWVITHHSELGVSQVLWWQRIWTVERSSEGWRPFADRGSATANHYDHVHVTVYGN